jgi:undecaprenyl-diphosphatase
MKSTQAPPLGIVGPRLIAERDGGVKRRAPTDAARATQPAAFDRAGAAGYGQPEVMLRLAGPTHPPVNRLRRLAPLLATLVVPALVFGALADRVARGETVPGDAAASRFIDTAIPVRDIPIAAGDVLALAVLGAAAALGVALTVLVRQRRGRELAFLVLGVAGMVALDPVLKVVFQRPPASPDGSGYSFPSGTAMVSLAVAGAVVVLLERPALRWTAIVVGSLAAVALGVSVVYLRWHHPSDVVAGWCLAAAWLSTLWLALGVPARTGPSPTRS